MKKTLLFSLVPLLLAGSYGFVRLQETEEEKINRLLDANELVAASAAIQNLKSSDSLLLHTAAFRLTLQDSSGDVIASLDHLSRMADGNGDTLAVNGLFAKYWKILRWRIDRTDPESLTAPLQRLVASGTTNFIRTCFAYHFKSLATRQQTVKAWNNCIVLWGDEKAPADLLSARRTIFFDTLAIVRNGISIDSVIAKNPCYLPLLTRADRVNDKAFRLEELYNPDYPRSDFLSSRYLVGDFNTQDAAGNCRGSYDVYADNSQLPEFKELFKATGQSGVDPYDSLRMEQWYQSLNPQERQKHDEAMWMWRNYAQKVEHFKTEPLRREPVVEVNGRQYCIGQRLCLCEIKNDTILMIAQFVTSTRNARGHYAAMKDYDDQPRYYAPKCFISTRYWDRSVPYDSMVIRHDQRMGFGRKSVIRYMGRADLANFMTISPSPEYGTNMGFRNGIHEFAAGPLPPLFMGTPVSLGCVRLHDYPSKFVRWWTPKDARFFIYYEYKRYVQRI